MNAPCKIMIVEDDPLFCEAAVAMLEENGYQVLTPVHTYEDAKKQLLQFEPDLALIDIGLPGEKDGIQLASYLFEHTQIPVVYITGHTDAVTLQRAKKSHPNAIVLKTKPVLNEKGLVEAISNQLLASILIAAPDGALHLKIKPKGLLLKVTPREINAPKTTHPNTYQNRNKDDKKPLIPFDDIQYIATYNHEIRNTILIKPAGKLGYVHRGTLSGIQNKLPDYFVKIKDYMIINIKKVTACIGDNALFINEERFDVSENYLDLVHQKKRIYLSHLF